MTDAKDVFNPKDFESIRLHVRFENFTTRTSVKDESQVSLVEIGDNQTLVLQVPAKCCNVKHSVMVTISQIEKDSKKETKLKELLSVTGKVLDLEDLDDDCARITVDCVQFDDKSWNDLLALYARRQEEITNFLAAVKG